MIPDPRTVAALVDDAEWLALRMGPPLAVAPRLRRRRLLAVAVFDELRRHYEDTGARVPEPMPV